MFYFIPLWIQRLIVIWLHVWNCNRLPHSVALGVWAAKKALGTNLGHWSRVTKTSEPHDTFDICGFSPTYSFKLPIEPISFNRRARGHPGELAGRTSHFRMRPCFAYFQGHDKSRSEMRAQIIGLGHLSSAGCVGQIRDRVIYRVFRSGRRCLSEI
jgi:hypothetical protein